MENRHHLDSKSSNFVLLRNASAGFRERLDSGPGGGGGVSFNAPLHAYRNTDYKGQLNGGV